MKSRYTPRILRKLGTLSGQLLLLAVAYLFLELCSLGVYGILNGTRFSFSALEQQRINVIRESINDATQQNDRFVIHPFVGVIRNYDNDRGRPQDINAIKPYGYYAEEDPFEASRASDTAIIAVAGGSVAELLLRNPNTRNIIRTHLKTLPRFKSKRVVFIGLCTLGYHQPQQLIATYLYLLQGGRIDLLINLDGRNEAINGFSMQQSGIYPGLTLYWPKLYKRHLPQQTETYEAAANIIMWKKIREQMATLSEYVRHSVTLSTLWSLTDAYLDSHIVLLEQEGLQNAIPGNYATAGPDTMKNASKEELAKFMLMLWQNSSEQMQLLADSYGFPYFHFLQPNQYVRNSKPLSPEEKSKYYLPNRMNELLADTYPLWQQGISDLQSQGVHAYDLTGLYKHTQATVYSDSCCHLNDMGNNMMAEAIGKQITQTLQKDAR